MSKWKVIRQDGVQAGIATEGCNFPFVTLHYVDAENIVEEHNKEVQNEEEKDDEVVIQIERQSYEL